MCMTRRGFSEICSLLNTHRSNCYTPKDTKDTSYTMICAFECVHTMLIKTAVYPEVDPEY